MYSELAVLEDEAPERGCGRRTNGGVYLVCPTSPVGKPIGAFLYDPPIAVPDTMSIPARGVMMIQDGKGVWHIVDRVGLAHYPNVADLIEEIAQIGLSRKLAPNLDFSRLTAESTIILVHDRGIIENRDEYGPCIHVCPTNKHGPDEQCAGVWWEDLEGGKKIGGRIVSREMPAFSYDGRTRPEGVLPQYRAAFVAHFPASRLEVVRGGNAEESFEKAQSAKIPVHLVSS